MSVKTLTRAEMQAATQEYHARFKPATPVYRARLGDGAGVVAVPGRVRYVYARLRDDSQVRQVLNKKVELADELEVTLGYLDDEPGILQVLGISTSTIVGDDGSLSGIQAHGASHGYGNYDPVFIDQRQETYGYLRANSPSSMVLNVDEFWYTSEAGAVTRFTAALTSSLAAYVPANAGQAAWVCVTINSSGSLAYTSGSAFNAFYSPDIYAHLPTPPAGIILGDVLLSAGMTGITQADIDGRRRSWLSGTSAAPWLVWSTATPAPVASAGSAGTSGSGSKSDHIHALPVDATLHWTSGSLGTSGSAGSVPVYTTYPIQGDGTSGSPVSIAAATSASAGSMSSTDKTKLDLLTMLASGSVSGSNTGDQTLVGLGGVPTARTISTTAPLTGGGDLSADRTLAISAATSASAGSMSAADKGKLDQFGSSITAGKVLTFAATDNYTLTVPATGTAALGTGAANRAAFWSGANTLTYDNAFIWDNGDKSLSIGGNIRVSGERYLITGTGYRLFTIEQSVSATRWTFGKNDAPESGSNVGSDFGLYRYTDDGSYLGTPLYVRRSDGQIIVGNNLSVIGYTTFYGNLHPRSNIYLINKADTAWLEFAVRNTTGSEAVYDLANIGNISIKGTLSWLGTDSTPAEQQQAKLETVWTNSTSAVRTALLRGTTVGNAANTGYFGQWSHSAVIDAALTVIPDGTGDVTAIATLMYALVDNTSGSSMGGVVTLNPGGAAYTLYSDGTDTWTATCAANGSVTVIRSAGTHSAKISIWGTWI